jgi:hypothetical protein
MAINFGYMITGGVILAVKVNFWLEPATPWKALASSSVLVLRWNLKDSHTWLKPSSPSRASGDMLGCSTEKRAEQSRAEQRE